MSLKLYESECQIYRKKVFEIYTRTLKEGHSKETAYEEAKAYIDVHIGKTQHYRYYQGLQAELLFYHLNRDSMNLKITTPEIDMYHKADFIGKDPLTGEPIMIDVTSNLRSKFKRDVNEWMEICKNTYLMGYKYRLAPIIPPDDYENLDKYIEENPVPYMIPISAKGYPGFTVVYLERENDNHFKSGYYNLLATPYIIFFDDLKNPSNVMDTLELSKQIIIYGAQPAEELIGYLIADIKDSGDEISPSDMEKEIKKVVTKDRFNVMKAVESTIGIYFSLSLESRYVITNPSNGDGYYEKYITWLHPLIQRNYYFGEVFSEFPWMYDVWW